jgi:methylmalonyl-CoA mutase cobalamin-binding domain/chain
VPALLQALREAGMQHVLVVVGGIIPPQVSTQGVKRGVCVLRCLRKYLA